MPQTQPLLDEWTPVHFGAGVLMALMEFKALDALLASGAWEILENIVAEAPGFKQIFPLSGAESIQNALFDIIVNMAGYATARVLMDS